MPEQAPKERRPSKFSTVNIPTELHHRARAAVRIVRRVTGRPYTIGQFFREATAAQLTLIARDYNDGREIPPDNRALSPGRPDGATTQSPESPQ